MSVAGCARRRRPPCAARRRRPATAARPRRAAHIVDDAHGHVQRLLEWHRLAQRRRSEPVAPHARVAPTVTFKHQRAAFGAGVFDGDAQQPGEQAFELDLAGDRLRRLEHAEPVEPVGRLGRAARYRACLGSIGFGAAGRAPCVAAGLSCRQHRVLRAHRLDLGHRAPARIGAPGACTRCMRASAARPASSRRSAAQRSWASARNSGSGRAAANSIACSNSAIGVAVCAPPGVRSRPPAAPPGHWKFSAQCGRSAAKRAGASRSGACVLSHSSGVVAAAFAASASACQKSCSTRPDGARQVLHQRGGVAAPPAAPAAGLPSSTHSCSRTTAWMPAKNGLSRVARRDRPPRRSLHR